MRLNICCGLSASFFLLAGPAMALEPSFFEEKINSEVDVSGHVIVGLMGSLAFQGIQQEQLVVSSSALGIGDSLCLKVSSRDGIYLLDGQYAVDHLPEQQVQLDYPTTKAEMVNGFKQDTVALSARLGACGSTTQHYLLPHFAQAVPKEVLLAINGFEATDVFFSIWSVDDGPVEEGVCDYIEHGRHTAYDYTCIVPLIGESSLYHIKIERELYGRELPTVELQLQR